MVLRFEFSYASVTGRCSTFVIGPRRVHSKGFSSILALHHHAQIRGCGDGSLQPLREELESPLGLVMDRVIELCEMILKRTEPELQSMPPLLLHCIYAAAEAASLISPERSKGHESIFRDTLQKLNTRWKVAGTLCLRAHQPVVYHFC
jgi:hypothetical protein